jgi:triacylglycerol lipase
MLANKSQGEGAARRRILPVGVMLVIGVVSMFAVVATAWATKHKTPARHTEPPITVNRFELAAAFHCPPTVAPNPAAEPVLLVPGIGPSGDLVYSLEKGAFQALGISVCYVDLPQYGTADMQTSVQYLVYAIRAEFKQAHRQIAILGLGAGGLLTRLALVYWPDLRRRVADAVAVASAEHGTTVPPHPGGLGCSKKNPCTAAVWQQARKAHLLKWLGKHHAQAPGPTSWTTVRSDADEVVRPQTGSRPTSSLKGASNILIQDVCPGRMTPHAGMAFDSVTFAVLFDAITHPGPAAMSRLPQTVCSTPYAKGVKPGATTTVLRFLYHLANTAPLSASLLVRAEPKVKKYFKH